jgi:PAS domain S-box-containing protein
LTATGGLYGLNRYLKLSAGVAWPWITAGTVAIAYFFAAQLGLALRSQPTDVAVFWPASGIAAGILIVLGRRAVPALVIGVVVGTVAANLMSDRTIWTSALKGFCNAGEAVLAAWLLERWFGPSFTFCNLSRVAGFVAAAGVATAASAIGGAATMTLLHTYTTAPYWDVWREWFFSGWVGLVVVAPLVIEPPQVWRTPPRRKEWIEGLGVLGLTWLACLFTMDAKTGSWLSFSPSAFVLPLLLWLTARCQPVFGIVGAFLASVGIICATTFGIGRFGDAAVPVAHRVAGAQLAMMVVTLFTLVLAVLFAQRKVAEGSLAKERAMLARLHEVGSRLWLKRDLRQALDDILAGAIELLGADMGTIRILDSTRGTLQVGAQRGFKKDFLDFFGEVSATGDSPCGRALRSGERMVIEDVEADKLFAPFRPLARSAGFRAVQSTPIMSREGALLGTLATHFRSVHMPADQDLRLLDLYVRQAADIIERHRAEDALRESEERLRLAQLKTGIGVWDWDPRTEVVKCTPELEAIFGLELGSIKCYADFRDLVHPEDIGAMEANRAAALRRHETFRNEFRITRPDGQVRWLSAMGGALYDSATGEPTRILGNNVDITERKLAERALAERNTQLELASKTALVGSFSVDFSTGIVRLSPASATIYGLPEGTCETSRYNVRQRVYPADLPQLEAQRDQAFLAQQREFNTQCRIVRADDGQVRWLEVRSLIFYHPSGKPSHLIGANIDITERKRTEVALAERNAQLTLAGRAALVGSYAYDVKTSMLQFSEGYAAIYDLPEGTREMTGDQRRALVHPEDLERLDRVCSQAFEQRRGEFNIEYRNILPKRGVRWIESRSLILYDSIGHPERLVGVNIDITERKQLEDQKNTLISELDHRVKNVLATISAVASRTQETSGSMAEFVAALDGRIKSMATTHELLSYRRWQGIPLAEIVRRELAPYATAQNTRIAGPDVVLSPEASQTLAMVFHELTTNAAKFGAISTGSGRVSVRWSFRRNGHAESWLCIDWQESGGPHVVPPTRSGFGTSVVRELIPYELGGTADLVHLPAGVRCKLEIPAHWLGASIPPGEPSSDVRRSRPV